MTTEYNVKQGSFRIDNNTILKTTGLATCSALSMIIGKYKFLAHIDATTYIKPIIIEINKYLKLQELTSDDISDITIYKGDGLGISDADYSYNLIKNLLMNIPIVQMDSYDIVDLGNIIQCNKCKSISGTLKIITHYKGCTSKEKVEIRNVKFWDTITI